MKKLNSASAVVLATLAGGGIALAPLDAQADYQRFETDVHTGCIAAQGKAPMAPLSQSAATANPRENILRALGCAAQFVATRAVSHTVNGDIDGLDSFIREARPDIAVFQQTAANLLGKHSKKAYRAEDSAALNGIQPAFDKGIKLGADARQCVANPDLPWQQQNNNALCAQLSQNIQEITGRRLEFYINGGAPMPPAPQPRMPPSYQPPYPGTQGPYQQFDPRNPSYPPGYQYPGRPPYLEGNPEYDGAPNYRRREMERQFELEQRRRSRSGQHYG